MTDREKLRVMLPHWVEHNRSHEAEFLKWAALAANAGENELARLLQEAVAGLKAADKALGRALELVGGAAESGHHHHHHHGDGHHHHHD